ncbi:DUF302 domain-containing protein [Ruegeria pomeroyi]|nr:DUF302 domain-containing protein [Ruegeria pomeroyi]
MEKLWEVLHSNSILGASNLKLAFRALKAGANVGLLLPFKVTVEEVEAGSIVRKVDAGQLTNVGVLAKTPEVSEFATYPSESLNGVARNPVLPRPSNASLRAITPRNRPD